MGSPFIDLFIQDVHAEYLLCAWHCSRSRDIAANKTNSGPCESYILGVFIELFLEIHGKLRGVRLWYIPGHKYSCRGIVTG